MKPKSSGRATGKSSLHAAQEPLIRAPFGRGRFRDPTLCAAYDTLQNRSATRVYDKSACAVSSETGAMRAASPSRWEVLSSTFEITSTSTTAGAPPEAAVEATS